MPFAFGRSRPSLVRARINYTHDPSERHKWTLPRQRATDAMAAKGSRESSHHLRDALAAYRTAASTPLDHEATAVLDRLAAHSGAASAFARLGVDARTAAKTLTFCVESDLLARTFNARIKLEGEMLGQSGKEGRSISSTRPSPICVRSSTNSIANLPTVWPHSCALGLTSHPLSRSRCWTESGPIICRRLEYRIRDVMIDSTEHKSRVLRCRAGGCRPFLFAFPEPNRTLLSHMRESGA